MTPAEFGEIHGASARTVQRWCEAGEIPGATRDRRNRWHIPPGSTRVEILHDDDDASRQVGAVSRQVATRRDVSGAVATMAALPQGGGLSAYLETLTAYISLEVAAQVLGIPEAAIRRNAEELGAKRWGDRGTLVVPLRAVRDAAGLRPQE